MKDYIAIKLGGSKNGPNITIDSKLSLTSSNPVQNKVITKAINELKETVDDLPDVDTLVTTENVEEIVNDKALKKITNYTENNIVIVGASGTVKDSDVNILDIAKQESIEDIEALIGTIPNGYEATTVIEYAKELVNKTVVNGYDDTELRNEIADIWDVINYKAPNITSFTMTPSATQYEIGSKINSLSFAWVLNKDVTSQTLTGCTISATDRSASYSSAITTNKTFILTVDDGKNQATASKSISFLPNVYFGASAEGTYNNAFILSLPSKQLKGSKAGNYSMNIASNTYGYLAVPKSYGQITTVNIGGFDTELDDLGVVSVTNESNYTQDYYLYKTTNKNLGNITMTVR